MPVNIVLDATMLDTFHSCPAKFNYRFNLNKVPELKPTALDRGTLVHVGFENYFRGLQEKLGYSSALEKGIESLRFTASTDECDLETNEIESLLRAFQESCELYRDDDENIEIIAVEQSFSYLLHEDDDMRLIMIGKIDLLVNHPSNFRYLPGESNVPYDHKTYSRDSPLQRLRNQFCNYTYATGANYLVVNRVGLQVSKKPFEKHKRVSLSYDPLFHEQWKTNTIAIARSYLSCASEEFYPMNLTSCDKFNRTCEYHEVCDSSGEDSKIFKLETNFKTADVWDVSSSLGGKE
jgi:hypothetical protein